MVNHDYYLQANSNFGSAKGFKVANYGEEYLSDNIIANHAIAYAYAYAYADNLGEGLGYDKAQELSVVSVPNTFGINTVNPPLRYRGLVVKKRLAQQLKNTKVTK